MLKRYPPLSANSKSWTPRPGPRGIYCSPACGRGCTRKEFQAANAGAAKITRALNALDPTADPPLWSPYVFENMGWFWGAQRVVGKVEPIVVADVMWSPSTRDYMAQVIAATRQFWGRDTSPVRAFKIAMANAKKEAETILSELQRI